MKNMLKLLTFISIQVLVIVILPSIAINNYYLISINIDENSKTALVLGASVNPNGLPSTTLRFRLDKAIELYEKKIITQILVSGDNRATNYNEPLAMKKYLISKQVKVTDITEDFGGRRTADSCWRAKNVFKIKKLYLVTQLFHMPRTNLLCKSQGLEVIPAIAKDCCVQVSIRGYGREILANWLAVKDAVYYEPDITGDGSERDLETVN